MQAWLAAWRAGDLAISNWVVTEFPAVSFRMLPVTGQTFRSAARFADRAQLGLRAGDALHLAIVEDRGRVLATRDKRLAAAGAVLGVPTERL